MVASSAEDVVVDDGDDLAGLVFRLCQDGVLYAAYCCSYCCCWVWLWNLALIDWDLHQCLWSQCNTEQSIDSHPPPAPQLWFSSVDGVDGGKGEERTDETREKKFTKRECAQNVSKPWKQRTVGCSKLGDTPSLPQLAASPCCLLLKSSPSPCSPSSLSLIL